MYLAMFIFDGDLGVFCLLPPSYLYLSSLLSPTFPPLSRVQNKKWKVCGQMAKYIIKRSAICTSEWPFYGTCVQNID